jgi:hypothetical protein
MNGAFTAADEACDLCKTRIAAAHEHIVDPGTRKIECVCQACAILFGSPGQKYRRVPKRVRFLPEFRMTDAQWDSLAIPVGIVFFMKGGNDNRILALYPSPAGAVESLLALDTWKEIEDDNPQARQLEPDVEGLLAYRIGAVREHYILPVDECFRLIGMVRLGWKGLSGGASLWRETTDFLNTLKQRSALRQ